MKREMILLGYSFDCVVRNSPRRVVAFLADCFYRGSFPDRSLIGLAEQADARTAQSVSFTAEWVQIPAGLRRTGDTACLL